MMCFLSKLLNHVPYFVAGLLGASSGSLPKPQDQSTQTDISGDLRTEALRNESAHALDDWSCDTVQQWLKQNDLSAVSEK